MARLPLTVERNEFQETESEEDRPQWGHGRFLYNVLGVCALCSVAFVSGVAWGGVSSDSSAPVANPSGFLQVVGAGGSGLDGDDEDIGLARYEQAAAVISQDWYAHTTDENVTYVTSEIEGRIPMPANHLMTLYHQTSPEACEGIMNSDFRLGKGGWCGKAIYFAVSPYDTKRKAVAGSSGHGCMLEVVVDVGRIKRFSTCGAFNLLTIRGVHRNGGDSVLFEPPEKSGDEVIIYEPSRVISKRIIPFKEEWMAHRFKGKLAR